MKFFLNKIVPALGLALAAAASQAAPIDVTAVVTEIGGVLTPVSLIGVAVLLVVVAIKAFTWVRKAI